MKEVNSMFLVFNKSEWKAHRWWTDEELKAADEKGFIGMKYGVNCYLARFLPVNDTEHEG